MGEIVNVREFVNEEKVKLKERVCVLKKKNVFPKFAVILANDDSASRIYISNERKICDELGVVQEEYILDEKVTTEEVIELIERLNDDLAVDGILVELPLYDHLNRNKILEKISPKKDVDGLQPFNLGSIATNQNAIIPCTARGIMAILESLNVKIEGKHVVIVGRGRIQKALFHLFLNKDATVTMCHSKTKDLKKYTKEADILIVAVGIPHVITKEMVKEDSIVIDVGINRVDGRILGDVDTYDVLDKVKYITPVPNGVGLTTVVSLVQNLVDIAEGMQYS